MYTPVTVFCSSVGGSSRVDILVCTPGRLVDHISSTSHFVLHHVRFLVIDEADRLLDQSYHGWLGKVLKAAYNKQYTAEGPISNNRYRHPQKIYFTNKEALTVLCSVVTHKEADAQGLFGWGCAVGTLEPLAYTRISSSEFCYPILD